MPSITLQETLLNNNTYLALAAGIGNAITGVPNGPVQLRSIEGACAGGANTTYYLQVLDAAGAGANAPMYSVGIMGGLPFSFVWPTGLDTSRMSNGVVRGENVLPVYLALSSTDGLYTAPVDGATAYVNVTLEEQTVLPTGATQTSATNAAGLTVFSDPNPKKRLCYVLAYNNTGADGFLMQFAKAGSVTGARPIIQWPVAAGATIVLHFSAEGVPSDQQDADGTLHTGCYLAGSSTTTTLTTVANGWTIYAWNI